MHPRLKKERVLISACLVNIGCRYDAQIRKSKILSDLSRTLPEYPAGCCGNKWVLKKSFLRDLIPRRKVRDLFEKAIFFPLCPEILAGFGIPRARIEIKGGHGEDVLDGKAEVITQEGVLVTEKMVKIAREILKFCLEAGIKKAIFNEKSPSCGKYFVYDGNFCGRLIEGRGVVTALLQREGIKVFSDEEYEQGIFEN